VALEIKSIVESGHCRGVEVMDCLFAQRLSISKYYTQADKAFAFLYHGVFST